MSAAQQPVGSKRPLARAASAEGPAAKRQRSPAAAEATPPLVELPHRIAELFEANLGAPWIAHVRALYPSVPPEQLASFYHILRYLAGSGSTASSSSSSSTASSTSFSSASPPATIDPEEFLRGREQLLDTPLMVGCVNPRAAALQLRLTADRLVLSSPLEKKAAKPVCVELECGQVERVVSVLLPNKRQQLVGLLLRDPHPALGGTDLLLLQVPVNEFFPPQSKMKVEGEGKPGKQQQGKQQASKKANAKDKDEDEQKQHQQDDEGANEDANNPTGDNGEPKLSPEQINEIAARAAASSDYNEWFRGSVLYLRANPRPLHEALANWLAHWTGNPLKPRPLDRYTTAGGAPIKCYQDRTEGSLYPLSSGLFFLAAGKQSTFWRMGSQLGRLVVARQGQSTLDFGVRTMSRPLEDLAEEKRPAERTVEYSMVDRESKALLDDYAERVAREWEKHVAYLMNKPASGQTKQEDKETASSAASQQNTANEDDDDDDDEDSDFAMDDDDEADDDDDDSDAEGDSSSGDDEGDDDDDDEDNEGDHDDEGDDQSDDGEEDSGTEAAQ